MIRRAFSFLLSCVVGLAALGANLPSAAAGDPAMAQYAVVRIYSHGISATVILTTDGRTVLLGCSHGYAINGDPAMGGDPKLLARKMTIDFPTWAPSPQPKYATTIRLIAIDYHSDLSLVEMTGLPAFLYCDPVAPAGRRSVHVISVGYDKMRWPATVANATPLETGRLLTWTREPPVPGRSGGGLIDADTGEVIGVCQAYEIGGRNRGIYASHQAILAFLHKNAALVAGVAPTPFPDPPMPMAPPLFRQPSPYTFPPFGGTPGCPPGRG